MRLQLDVGRVAAERLEMGLDGLHFGQRQIELPLAAQPLQGRVVHRAGWARSQAGTRRASRLAVGPNASGPTITCSMASLARTLAASSRKPLRRAGRRSSISSACGPPRPDAEIGDGRQRALGHRVHHARLGQDVNQPGAVRPSRNAANRAVATQRGGEHPSPTAATTVRSTTRSASSSSGDPLHLARSSALDQIAAGGGDWPDRSANPSSAAAAATSRPNRSGWPVGRIDVNFPKHRGSSSQW